jgi:predicted GIY-YIG superfamily endonuclease
MFYVYILQNELKPNITYIGKTNNIYKRLRQHNNLLSGGAKFTKRYKKWKMLCFITSYDMWFDDSTALRLEWKLKKIKCDSFFPCGGNKYILRKLSHVLYSFNLIKWTSKAPRCSKNKKIFFFIHPKYYDLINPIIKQTLWSPDLYPLPTYFI